jgi:hypothetical protein
MQYRRGLFCATGSVEVQMMRWDTNIGSADQEKFGHLFAGRRDPLADIPELERVKFVTKGGQVIRNELNSLGGNGCNQE